MVFKLQIEYVRDYILNINKNESKVLSVRLVLFHILNGILEAVVKSDVLALNFIAPNATLAAIANFMRKPFLFAFIVIGSKYFAMTSAFEIDFINDVVTIFGPCFSIYFKAQTWE